MRERRRRKEEEVERQIAGTLANRPSGMSVFAGSDDIFDAALNVEGAAFEKGRADGEEDAKKEGFYDDGVKSGFMRGYALLLLHSLSFFLSELEKDFFLSRGVSVRV